MQDLNSFHDVPFPLGVSFGATGGPEWRNEIVSLISGHEKRNARWAMSRHYFDAGTGLRSLNDLRDVLRFFEARRGSLYAFRFRDPFDHLSSEQDAPPQMTDQLLGIGDGTTRNYQLVKRYGDYARPVTKPVTGSVSLAVDGNALTYGEAFTVDWLSGIVAFATSFLPPPQAVITAGFLFDVPVRFDTDRLSASIASFKAGEIPSIPIVEVK
ncbi:phage distal tail protein, Rcc01695 family [Pseudochrobactrum sp. MP213Fo]|uniref:phage distal tail protein, Rcc01695 family n=1 Tax=Pseudochrobactrum sp. MP213Fo TaxID=3022250 RepID=UPI003BA39E3D